MLEVIDSFWDFFFYVLFHMDAIEVYFYIMSGCLVCFAVAEFVRKVLNECM